MQQEQPAVVAGIYTQPYNEIVRPERVWKISKYFLRRWTPYLSANEVWLVIGARQLSYFNERRPWFRAYDRTLAEAAGLHVKVFRRKIKKAICEGTGAIGVFLHKTADPQYTRSEGVTRQTQTRYAIRLDDPLTPGDAQALAYWLRRNSPQRVTAPAVQGLLEEAAVQKAARLLATEPGPDGEEETVVTLPAVTDVVSHVFPALPQEKGWLEAADRLHTHLVAPEVAHFETQYFRRQWLPLLDAGPALLLTYLRSLCYHNEEQGEIRDEVALESGQLEAVLQVSSRTLRRWFAKVASFDEQEATIPPFVQVLDAVKKSNQKVTTTYRVGLQTPLTPDDLQRYRGRLAELENGANRVTDISFPTVQAGIPGGDGQKVPHTSGGDGQKVAHTLMGERQTVPHTVTGEGQMVAHTNPGSGQKVVHAVEGDGQTVPDGKGGEGQIMAGWETDEGSYKYYKILLNLRGQSQLKDLTGSAGPDGSDMADGAWLVDRGRAQAAFAVVVGEGGTGAFLDRIGVLEPARGEILAQHVGLNEAVAWMLYAWQEPGLERPLSFVISRLQRGDPPPMDFVQLASLSWEQWRAYAWAWCACGLPAVVQEAFRGAPLFETWGAVYGHLHADDLPFDVGVGLDEARLARPQAVGATGNGAPGRPEMAALPAEQALWQGVLDELALQMTRATFDAWLRGARLMACEGDAYVIAVASPEARAWLSNRLQGVVERTVKVVTGGRVKTVRFVVRDA